MSGRKASLVLAVILVLVTAACGGTAPGPSGAGAEWHYSGADGPLHWASLDPAYAACGSGERQSPVNLEGAQHAPASVLSLDYRPATFSVTDSGHSIEAESSGAGGITLGGTRFELVQFHFHAPSEHTLAGRYFPMELHLVHRDAGRRLAVVGVLIREGDESQALAPVFSDVPAKGHEAEVELSPAGVLPASRASYRYMGSLTTPPCTEGVRWIVLREPIELSRDQILAFTHRYFGINRPLQPLNGRMLAETG